MQMAHIIEVLMLSVAALILLLTGTSGMKAAKSSVFNAGMQAVVAIFGIAWMGDTFISGNIAVIKENIFGLVTDMPWLFGIALLSCPSCCSVRRQPSVPCSLWVWRWVFHPIC